MRQYLAPSRETNETRRSRTVRLLMAQAKHDNKEEKLVGEETPRVLYEVPDTTFPLQMLHTMALIYANEQLEYAGLVAKGNPMEIKFEDLVVRCKHCNGTGRIDTSTGASQGLPGVGVTGYSGDCIECGGLGGELTESGKAVRQLIEWMRSRHLI
jgi:hypothetical protein